MSSARQLIYQNVEGNNPLWYNNFTQYMRPLRQNPNYYRITDKVSWTDGPPATGEQYTLDNITWRAEIDSEDNAKVNILNQDELFGVIEETFDAGSPVDSVSLEFDQLGRVILLYEADGDINIYWYNPLQGSFVSDVIDQGRTPWVVSDTYQKKGNASTSERFIFYVSASKNKVVYRRQSNRFTVEYELPAAPQDVTEILVASKNLYGGFTVVACYEDTSGDVQTISWTAVDDRGDYVLGTDGEYYEVTSVGYSGDLVKLVLTDVVVPLNDITESVSSQYSGGSLVELKVELPSVILEPASESETMSYSTGSLVAFNVELATSEVAIESPQETETVTYSTGSLVEFDVTLSIISTEAEELGNSVTYSTGSLETFTIG